MGDRSFSVVFGMLGGLAIAAAIVLMLALERLAGVSKHMR